MCKETFSRLSFHNREQSYRKNNLLGEYSTEGENNKTERL